MSKNLALISIKDQNLIKCNMKSNFMPRKQKQNKKSSKASSFRISSCSIRISSENFALKYTILSKQITRVERQFVPKCINTLKTFQFQSTLQVYKSRYFCEFVHKLFKKCMRKNAKFSSTTKERFQRSLGSCLLWLSFMWYSSNVCTDSFARSITDSA